MLLWIWKAVNHIYLWHSNFYRMGMELASWRICEEWVLLLWPLLKIHGFTINPSVSCFSISSWQEGSRGAAEPPRWGCWCFRVHWSAGVPPLQPGLQCVCGPVEQEGAVLPGTSFVAVLTAAEDGQHGWSSCACTDLKNLKKNRGVDPLTQRWRSGEPAAVDVSLFRLVHCITVSYPHTQEAGQGGWALCSGELWHQPQKQRS